MELSTEQYSKAITIATRLRDDPDHYSGQVPRETIPQVSFTIPLPAEVPGD